MIRTARFDELDVHTLYALLRLRVDVFVVEQHCAYGELDGWDTEPSTLHCWVPDDEGPGVASALRLLDDAGVARIGRVVTAAGARRRGLATELMRHALSVAGRPVVITAQSHLAPWYSSFGFVPDGDEFTDWGIAHIPMRLDDRATPHQ